MSEQIPQLSDEVASLAWEAALASNKAFDERAEIQTKISKLGEIAGEISTLGVPGVALQVDAETSRGLSQVLVDAQAKFDQLQTIAGDVMGPTVVIGQREADERVQSLWSLSPEEAIEPIEVPEIDAETVSRLETISPKYFEQVAMSYGSRYVTIERAIQRRILPEAYRLPELSALLEQAEAVAASYEYMRDQQWEPRIEFAPQGLTRNQWKALLTGQKLPDGNFMNGNWYGFDGELIDPTDSRTDLLWSVDVISANDGPIFRNVSKDGNHGSNAKEAVKSLKQLPNVGASDPAEVIAQASPSEATYNALQLSKVEQAERPVDAETWTISKENVEVDGVLRAVFRYFVPSNRQVRSVWDYLSDASSNVGVRPSASGKNLVFSA